MVADLPQGLGCVGQVSDCSTWFGLRFILSMLYVDLARFDTAHLKDANPEERTGGTSLGFWRPHALPVVSFHDSRRSANAPRGTMWSAANSCR